MKRSERRQAVLKRLDELSAQASSPPGDPFAMLAALNELYELLGFTEQERIDGKAREWRV